MSCTCCGAGCLFLTCVALGNRISVSFCLTPPTLDAMMSCSVCPVLLGPSSAALYCQSGNQPGPGQSEAELYVACDLPANSEACACSRPAKTGAVRLSVLSKFRVQQRVQGQPLRGRLDMQYVRPATKVCRWAGTARLPHLTFLDPHSGTNNMLPAALHYRDIYP